MEKLTAEVVSSLKDCPRQKEGKPLQGSEEPSPADVQPPRNKTPRRGSSAERDLAKAREAHWRALATVATLEEKIEAELVHYLRLARCLCPLSKL